MSDDFYMLKTWAPKTLTHWRNDLSPQNQALVIRSGTSTDDAWWWTTRTAEDAYQLKKALLLLNYGAKPRMAIGRVTHLFEMPPGYE